MEKINVVLVILNAKNLEQALKTLNFSRANLCAIVIDGGKGKFLNSGTQKIPLVPFSAIQNLLDKGKNFIWLISGVKNTFNDIWKTKNFLMISGIPEENIINFETTAQISETWLANVHHVEEYGVDFFATGNEYMRDGLNLKFIPRAQEDKASSLGGANLCYANQDLQQSYQIAQYVFEHVAPGIIKFVLIGLTPDFLFRESEQYFSNVRDLLKLMTVSEKADLNFDVIKKSLNRDFSAQSIVDWQDDSEIFSPNAAEKNIQVLKDYIGLCLKNDAQPVGVVFPFAPATRETYNKETLENFREIIHQLEMDYDFICVDMFELNLDYSSFCNMTHLNGKGMLSANAFLSFKLYEKNLIPAKNFCFMTYKYFHHLSSIIPKQYHSFIERVLETSARSIRRKEKIKIGFALYDSSMWCGDELYNFFAADERFETTIFLCLRRDEEKNEVVKNDLLRGAELFKSHGLNFIAADRKKMIPQQDVIIWLTPYMGRLFDAFRPKRLTLETLIFHIPYSYDISVRKESYYAKIVFHASCKVFFSSIIGYELYDKMSPIGVPRGVYAGYPRTDIFFQSDADFHFNWKMVRPNAKKIIWAPHHSITGASVVYSTFQWNYKFMYEFAKVHPETSWVVKPHPNLPYRAVDKGIFPSIKAFEDYLQAWDKLPNAQVYTGAYYQEIFATSDGMIHDSGSFIVEYQYVDKPMIYLTRDTQNFNELANEILSASYTVDGKDLDAIAALMQRVFIEGDDYKAAERRKIFDKYLNYPKYNGMLASEFIYKSIVDELK